MKLLPAKVLLKQINDWKANGLPADFAVPTAIQPPATAVIPSTPEAGLRVLMHTCYYRARYCGDNTGFQYVKLLAQADNMLACSYLAVIYFRGCSMIPKDAEQSKLLAERAVVFVQAEADNGCKYAQHCYGNMLYDGCGVTKNEAEAARYYKLAAAQSDAQAQYALSKCYLRGRGVGKNLGESVRYCMAAAEQGLVKAQSTLGVYYQQGIGVPKNQELALHYFKMAAEQGDADAVFSPWSPLCVSRAGHQCHKGRC